MSVALSLLLHVGHAATNAEVWLTLIGLAASLTGLGLAVSALTSAAFRKSRIQPAGRRAMARQLREIRAVRMRRSGGRATADRRRS
jgi:hypothetical protein